MALKKKPNPYDILGVSPGASEEDVKKAWRRLAFETHPDRHEQESAAEKLEKRRRFDAVNDAYQEIKGRKKREDLLAQYRKASPTSAAQSQKAEPKKTPPDEPLADLLKKIMWAIRITDVQRKKLDVALSMLKKNRRCLTEQAGAFIASLVFSFPKEPKLGELFYKALFLKPDVIPVAAFENYLENMMRRKFSPFYIEARAEAATLMIAKNFKLMTPKARLYMDLILRAFGEKEAVQKMYRASWGEKQRGLQTKFGAHL